MNQLDALAEDFERYRGHLRAVAYRMLGSISEADDAVQDTWLRASSADISGVKNLAGWLTTVVGRVCLNMLRSRAARREQPFAVHMPDPVVSRLSGSNVAGSNVAGSDPEHEALLADSVGLALLVVLDTLAPAERLAFVLHDSFAVPFDEIATIVGTSTAAARQLASRARRRVQAAPVPDADLGRQRKVVDAFFAASRDGDFAALVAMLDPDVVLQSDGGLDRPTMSILIHGGERVAAQAITFGQLAPHVRPALVNAAAGVVVAPHGRPISIMGFTVRAGKIVAINVLADPARLDGFELGVWES